MPFNIDNLASVDSNSSDRNATLVNTITVPGSATDLFEINGGSSGANVNRLGGFGSDFFYDYRSGFYYGLADRGPGGGTLPYQTRVDKISLTVDPDSGAASHFQVVETIPFYIPAGTTLNGVTYTVDTPFNGLNSKLLSDGGNGSLLAESQDPEGFVIGANGNFFVSDEYGPSVYEFEPTGKFVRAFTPPTNVLPTLNGAPYYAADVSSTTGRQDNRGYEGLAISPDGTKLFAVFQDPLQEEGSGGSNPGRNSRNVRIVRYDIATGLSDAQYIYQLESISDINDRIPGTENDFSASAQGRNIGISSLVAINNTELLVLERDNRGIGVDPSTNLPIGSKRVYKIDLTGATDVSNISLAGTNTLPASVTPVSKSLFLDIAEALQTANQTVPEKIEGLALGPQLADGSFSLILATDNDFSVTQNSSGTQFDVYTDGTQQPIDSPPPASGATLLPSYIYAFKAQPNALDVTPVFDFSANHYSFTEGNTPGFSTNAAVQIIRRGALDGTDSIELTLSDGTATGAGVAPSEPLVTGPKSSQSPYILPTAEGVSTKSILTVGDSVGGYEMVGIPDGLGAFDNGDGTFTLLMNHEIPVAVSSVTNGIGLAGPSGAVRAHGNAGAFVSMWTINKSDLSVNKIEDFLPNEFSLFLSNNNPSEGTPHTGYLAAATTLINRLCSADLGTPTAYGWTDSTTGTFYGTTARIFQSGEESGGIVNGFASGFSGNLGSEGTVHFGRQFAFVTTDDPNTPENDARTVYELPHSGLFAWENNLTNPFSQRKTIAMGMDDSNGGQLYVWVGDKQTTGNVVERAGLTKQGPSDNLYVVKVAAATLTDDDYPGDTNPGLSEARATPLSGTFTLENEGDVSGLTFSQLESLSDSKGATQFLRPEDGAWDPNNPNDFYFVTTDRYDEVKDGVGTQVARSRLYRLRFDDITQPELGGTIEAVLGGTEAGNMFDNMTIDRYGHILLQEDVGNQAHLGKIWQYDIATDTLTQIAQHDPTRFTQGATNFLTQDEESSGIIDAQNILGPGWFLLDVQAHYSIPGELVEGGQLLALFNPDTYKSAVDYNNSALTVTFNPGESFKDVLIPISGDTASELNETINLRLVNPSAGTLIGTRQPNATLSILNDDSSAHVATNYAAGSTHFNVTAGLPFKEFTIAQNSRVSAGAETLASHIGVRSVSSPLAF